MTLLNNKDVHVTYHEQYIDFEYHGAVGIHGKQTEVHSALHLRSVVMITRLVTLKLCIF